MNNYTHLSFDCYGTLIDWETGILNFFKELSTAYSFELSDIEILKLYAEFEAEAEHGKYKPYKEILRDVFERFANYCGFNILAGDEYILAESVKKWPPYYDSKNALIKLQKKYKLVIISNIDDDLFEFSQELLGVKFDHIFTAYKMKSYKPSLNNFKYVEQHLKLSKHQWLHVAQSLYHDHQPASQLGIDTVWIKRQSIVGEQGVAPEVDFKPNRVYSSMEDFAKAQLEN